MRFGKEINVALENANLSSLLKTPISPLTLQKTFHLIAKQFGAKVKIKEAAPYIIKKFKQNKRTCYISGEYEDGGHPVIYLNFRPQVTEFILTKGELNKLIFLFSQTLQHEHIHVDQYLKKRGVNMNTVSVPYSTSSFKKFSEDRKEDVVYYALGYEISTHAHDIAMEIVQYYSEHSMREMFSGKKPHLRSYYAYKRTYKGLNWDKLRKALLKKTYYWIPSITPVYQL